MGEVWDREAGLHLRKHLIDDLFNLALKARACGGTTCLRSISIHPLITSVS